MLVKDHVENPQDLLLDDIEIDDSPPTNIPAQLGRGQGDICSTFHLCVLRTSMKIKFFNFRSWYNTHLLKFKKGDN